MNNALTIAAVLGCAFTLTAGEPILKLESHEPLSLVTSTAFSEDGRLFTVGFDKVVRGWKQDARGWSPSSSFRVPVGPGMAGALNDVAISDDGRWLATGGSGWFKKLADFRRDGVLFGREAIEPESKLEIGVVQLFERSTNTSFALSHHRGPLIALAFDGTTLASLAWEETTDREVGEYSVAIWDAPTKRLLSHTRLSGQTPPTRGKPAFVVRKIGAEADDAAVTMTFRGNDALVWRPRRAAEWKSISVGRWATCAVRGPGTSVLVGCRNSAGEPSSPAFVRIDLDGPEPAVGAVLGLALEAQPRDAIIAATSTVGADRTVAFVFRSLVTGDDTLYAIKNDEARPYFRQRLGRAGQSGSLSISPDGTRVSIAQTQSGGFVVHSLNDPNAAPFTIVGKGVEPAKGRFVERNGELGFKFTVPTGAGQELNVVLDPVASQLTTDLAGWRESDHQSTNGILVQSIDDSTLQCTTAQGASTIKLKKLKATVWCTALPKAGGVPLVAVAAMDATQQTELYIYRADTGERLRRCSAHTAPIVDLAVSADGGLLLSTARDRTCAMWNVADLGDPVRVVGSVRAATFDEARRIVRSDIPELQPGDVLVGRANAPDSPAFATMSDVNAAVSATKPGTTLVVVAERNGQQFQVGLPIVQGMDERKPLMQCYCRDGNQWIAWSPLGPYDSNVDAAEGWIGWHFNPEGNTPVRFAVGTQYRKEYRRQGLLRRMLQTRSLVAALESWRRLDAEPPDPSIALSVSPIDAARDDATVVLQREVEVSLRVTNGDFPLERLASLQTFIGDEPVALERVKPNEFRGKATLKRPGKHALRMTASTKAPLPRNFEDERTLLFAPPKPALKPTAEWIGRSNAKADAAGVWTLPNQEGAETRLQASLAADESFQGMQTRITVNGEPISNAGALSDLRIPLRIGENRVVVVSEPKTTFEGIDARTEMVVVVRRTEPPKTFAPPTIALERLEVGPDRSPMPIPASGTATVARSLVQVKGRIRSEEDVASVAIDGIPLADFQRTKDGAIVFEKRLTPGVNRIRVSAKGASGVESKQEVAVELKPALPKPIVGFERELRDLRWTGEEIKRQSVVRFEPTLEKFPVVATLKRNGVVVGKVERTTDDPTAWTADVTLVPGENRLSVEVEASWGKVAGSTATAWVRRPPKLLKLAASSVGAKPFVDLTAEVETLDGWPATEFVLNGRVHDDVKSERMGPANAQGVVRWKLVAANVALLQGGNDFSATVRNAEGESQAAVAQGIVYAPPPPPRALVAWESPRSDGNRDDSALDVKLKVESSTPVSSAALTVGGKTVKVALHRLAGLPDGATTYEVRERIELAPGENALALRVLNGGGETRSDQLTLNYVPKPVVLKISSLQANDAAIEPTRTADGAAAFGPVASGRQTLVGEVAFADPNSPALKAPASVRVMVNGLQQQTAELGPAEGNVRRFRAPILLNKSGRNDLLAEVVGLSLDADCNLFASISQCKAPITRQRLHLVLIGVGEGDEAKLRKEATEAFQASINAGSPGKPAFESVVQRHAACGYVTAPTIREAVDKLRMELVESSARQEVSNVVGFYFRGELAIEKDRPKLLTSEPAWMPRSKFDAGDLATRFADVPGAQLLLLDVSPHGNSEDLTNIPNPFKRSNAALLGFRRAPKEKPMLFSMFEKTMPAIGNLGELQRALAKTPLPPGARFENDVPAGLEGLVVGRGE